MQLQAYNSLMQSEIILIDVTSLLLFPEHFCNFSKKIARGSGGVL